VIANLKKKIFNEKYQLSEQFLLRTKLLQKITLITTKKIELINLKLPVNMMMEYFFFVIIFADEFSY